MTISKFLGTSNKLVIEKREREKMFDEHLQLTIKSNTCGTHKPQICKFYCVIHGDHKCISQSGGITNLKMIRMCIGEFKKRQ